jgi:hypothetical protein
VASKKPSKVVPHNEPTPERRPPSEVLRVARQMLGNAQRGLEEINSSDPSLRIPGLHSVAVFGRAVTVALQRLRHIVDGFDDWYSTQVPTKDPLLAYFNKLRNGILKEALSPQPATAMRVEYLSDADVPGRASRGNDGLVHR